MPVLIVDRSTVVTNDPGRISSEVTVNLFVIEEVPLLAAKLGRYKSMQRPFCFFCSLRKISPGRDERRDSLRRL
jgi:hypothetical protein